MNENHVIPEAIYFATYVAVSDNRLYDQEWCHIEKLLKEENMNQEVRDNVLLIIQDSSSKISLDTVIDILSKSSEEQKNNALRLGLQIAYKDGFFGEKEQVIFMSIREKLKIRRKQYDTILGEVRSEAEESKKNKDNSAESQELSDRYSKCVFSSKDYNKVVNAMSEIAGEDLEVCSKAMNEVTQTLRKTPELIGDKVKKKLKSELRKTNGTEGEQIDNFFCDLISKIDSTCDEAERHVQTLLRRQDSSVTNYTISFMGRTKAGKSTLHSVLLGGINSEFIGNGAERTTRFNYVYDYQGIHMIDTPGIGAPGGKSDTEIAREVIDESDLICYVVTSDSIQETEFNFMKEMKNRNKPIIILLNKKENIERSTKKKQAFIDDPLDWYDREGEDSIHGHMDRINSYIEKNYGCSNYRIVPVHLLAARLSQKEQNSVVQERLWKGSRIDEFLLTVKNMISDYGKLQRSQTIYNASVYYLDQECQCINEQKNMLSELRQTISQNGTLCTEKISELGRKQRNEIIASFDSEFDSFINEEVRRFANMNFATPKKELEGKWKAFLAEGILEKKLKTAYESAWEIYRQKVSDVLEEAEENISFSINYGSISDIAMINIFDAKAMVNFAGAIIGGVALFFAANPVGWILAAISIVAFITGMFLKDKSKKIELSKDSLFNSLSESLQTTRKKNLEEILKRYDNVCCESIKKIEGHYDLLGSVFSEIEEKLQQLNNNMSENLDRLNLAFGARVANYIIDKKFYNIKNENSLSTLSVQRKFKEEMVIRDRELFIQPIIKSISKLSEILQEEVTIKTEE